MRSLWAKQLRYASDEALAVRVQQGDLSALDALYERYKVPIYEFLYRWTHCIEDAEDLTQEIFPRVHLVWRHSGRLFLAQGPMAPGRFARLLDRCIEAGMRPSGRKPSAKGAAREPAPRLPHGSRVPQPAQPAQPGVRL